MSKTIIAFACYICIVFVSSCTINKKLVSIDCKDAPKVIGPYSHAVKTGNLVYTSGQVGISPVTNAFAGEDINAQANQALKNIKAIVEEAGSDMEHVVKVTIFLKDMNDYATVNNIYKDYFPTLKPARSTVQVVRLPKEALIEIEGVAVAK